MVTPYVFDAHVDSLQLALDLGVDLGQRGPGHLDLVRAREGGLGAVVLTSWVDPKFIVAPGGARARTEALFDAFHSLLERHPDKAALVLDAKSLADAREQGKIAAILGIEGGHAIEESLDLLEYYWSRGLRVMTLVWNNHLSWIRSCVEETANAETPAGLTEFGRQVVGRMNELGILVDLSHAAERSFYDALETSTTPVIASHSACKALHDHPRNLSDAQLTALAQNGGVVGIPFLPCFLDAQAQAAAAQVYTTDGYRAFEADNDTQLFLAQSQYLSSRAEPLSIERLIDHIAHIAQLIGVEHVGFGSDFDGIQFSVEGLTDASCYATLEAPLERRGFNADEIHAILGGNMARVFCRAAAGA